MYVAWEHWNFKFSAKVTIHLKLIIRNLHFSHTLIQFFFIYFFLFSGSLPATPTPSTSDMGFFCSSPRPNTLSINSNSNSSSTQGTTDTSSQSALDSSIPNTSGHCLEQENENSSQFTKMKSKRTLAETVDLLRHSSNLNGISVFKKNSLKEKTLTPSDDQSRNSSRNSSRSGSPNITPIKSEVLTPSCTPCSTPKKSPSCSPSPSLDRAPVTKINKDQKYLFRKGDTVLAQWHDGLYYLGKILKVKYIDLDYLF